MFGSIACENVNWDEICNQETKGNLAEKWVD